MKTHSLPDSRKNLIKPDACRILFHLFICPAASVRNLRVFPGMPLPGSKIDHFQAVYASRGVDVNLHRGEKYT
ncbi:MAG: hypothetical protein A4E41_00607 [Methanoregulaceae archaeon PtaU1.Bin066]|nr:MAG: hypothetical protein A4E41_00607 [Methanoregulaceae archaeon PtaU1.Bin066]